MITFRKLNKNDNILLNKLIFTEGFHYKEFLKIGWSENQIIKQFNKSVNLSFGGFYQNSLISFMIGDLFNIEKISEYEILLIYVCKNFRKKGLATELLGKIVENNDHLKKIYLEVSKNNLKGISFYKKMNFKKFIQEKIIFHLKIRKLMHL